MKFESRRPALKYFCNVEVLFFVVVAVVVVVVVVVVVAVVVDFIKSVQLRCQHRRLYSRDVM
jgi:hypothetical protein